MNNVLVQAWGPLARGQFLTPDATDPLINELRRLLTLLSEEKQCSVEAIALAWLLKHPAGIQPVIGTVKPERISACCQADGVELSREEWYKLFEIARGNPVP